MSALVMARNLRWGCEERDPRGVSFDLAAGECLGLLGPTHAGKSAMLARVGCQARPTGGQLKVLGMDATGHARSIRARLGIVPQRDDLDSELRCIDHLILHGVAFGLSAREARRRAGELLAFFDCPGYGDRRIAGLQQAERRRLLLVRALLPAPDLLLLDEPTAGLARPIREAIWQRLQSLHRTGTAMLLACSDPLEAWQLCDRVLRIEDGTLLDSEPAPLQANSTVATVADGECHP